MSNALPPNASLEWLKKHAKQRKAALRTDGEPAKLSDVQFVIAKEYGFSSWRSLKAHLERATGSSSRDPDKTDVFLRCVAEGDVDGVRAALGADPDMVNAIGKHPFWGGRPQALHLSIEGNRQDVFDMLLASGADVNGSNEGYEHWSPLMLALFNNRDDMADALKQRGAATGLCEALLAADDQRLDECLSDPKLRDAPRPEGSVIGFARTEYAVTRLIDEGFSSDDKNRWGSDALDALSRLGRKGQPLVDALVARRGHLRAVDRQVRRS